MATDEPDRDRPTDGDDLGARGTGSTADERDRLSDDRDRIADEREAAADGREREADDRQRVADDRDSDADDREVRANDPDGSDAIIRKADADELRRDQSVERDAARLDRERATADREDAEMGRGVGAAGRERRFEEALAVSAHLALTSSAIVIMGLESLKAHWPRMRDQERVLTVDRVHHHAHTVDKALRRFIPGEPV